MGEIDDELNEVSEVYYDLDEVERSERLMSDDND